MNGTAHAAARGRRDGYRAGWSEGYRLGRCEAIRRQAAALPIERLPLRILYIPQGFEAIDYGVIEALNHKVAECLIGDPRQMARQAIDYRPDLVLVLNGMHVFPDDHLQQIDAIRGAGIRTAIWFADDPYFSELTAKIAPRYDYVFTHELSCAGWYRQLGCPNAHYLPLAASTTLFRPIHVEAKYRTDVCFIGMGFQNRIRFFDQLAPYLSGLRVFIAGALWNSLKHYRQLAGKIKLDWIPVPETASYYSGAKIVLNVHRMAGGNQNSYKLPAKSLNPRTFEIAACGAFQLTDVREDLPLYFTPGQDIATYRSAREAARLIRHYLTHEDERRRLAWNALRRTCTEHTFANRLDRLFRIVFEGA
ncbi:glycosyltransferase [Paenibacillus thermoaerophilus]|uniref:Glycosyltransferase n=1 Tax=Paenibacillus thermoaerophilus TaxID=1215385 RepID=A0ABW2V0U2_9BACL|nr:glycosyltransferase [Paenibacillus thermoaerophilus]